jgi:hypothetical protein
MASLPKRAESYFGPAKPIISMAQQASPIGIGMSELDRAQLSRASTRVVKKPCPLLALDPAIRVQAVEEELSELTAPRTTAGDAQFDGTALNPACAPLFHPGAGKARVR